MSVRTTRSVVLNDVIVVRRDHCTAPGSGGEIDLRLIAREDRLLTSSSRAEIRAFAARLVELMDALDTEVPEATEAES
jgi:hypothetical protein